MKANILKNRIPLRFLRGSFAGAVLLLLLSAISRPVQAQTFSSSIAGTVTDASGAVVRGADLQLENLATHDARTQKSGEDGAYNFTSLLPGTYQITASAAGFKDFVRTGMVLAANTAATVDVSLQVGNTQEKVVVSANSVLVDTESATNSVTMDQALLQSLPNNTLQPLNFVFALAGTTESQGETSRSTSYDQNASMFGLNGGRTGESEILIDGAPSTAIDWGGLMVSPINDSIQEQQVSNNIYDAQYERGAEGVVTLVTRSGGSEFHGEIYDYMRNNGLDANDWADNNSGIPRGKFHRNQFGANAGGPLWRKHHLFVFGAYEGLRQPYTQGSGLLTVPTDAEKKGDFSHTYLPNGKLDVIYNPFSTHLVTASDGSQYYTRDPYPGNIITSGFDTVGQAIAALYPSPNHPSSGPNDQNNFVKQGSGLTANDKFDWRIDWAKSEKQRLFVRMSDRVRQNDDPPCFFCNGADEGANNHDHGLQLVLNDTITPNAKWIFNIYGAYSRWWEGQTSIGYGVANASKIGLDPADFQVDMLPLVNVSNYFTLGSTYSSYDRYVRYLSTGIINVSRQLNVHTLRFGFNYDVGMINQRQDSPGNFNFDPSLTSCDPAPTGVGTDPCQAQNAGSALTGNSVASLLLGTGSGGGASISTDPAMSQHSFGMYLQDEWRATNRLTVNAGLRYENQRPATERHNRIAYFDEKLVNPLSSAYGSTLYGGYEFAGVDGRGRGAWEPDNKNFGPRLGLAYRLTDKLVARAGSGIFFGPASAMLGFDDGGQSPGFTASTNWIATDNAGYQPLNLVSNPFPQGIQQPTGSKLGPLTYVGYGNGQIWPKVPHPIGTLYQWSADLQYQVSPHSAAELGYTGIRGRHLLYGNPNININQLPTQDLALGSKLDDVVDNPLASVITDPNSDFSQPKIAYNQLLRPFPEFGDMTATRSLPGARSQFDALSAKYTYSFANGLSSITTYQWSKNLDDGSEALLGWLIGNMWRDSYHPKLDYAVSTHDLPHSFAEAWTYQLPYGRGRKWGSDMPQALNQVIGGWNISGIIRLSSGYPFGQPVNFGWSPLNAYGFQGPALPDLIAKNPTAHHTAQQWINPAAFQGVSSTSGAPVACGNLSDQCQPFSYHYGNEPQRFGTLREAPTKNLDLGIAKEFGTEKIHAQLRGDILNAFNHPIYGGFNTGYWSWNIEENLYASNFGQVYGTRNDPRNIQVSLKISY